MSSDNVNPPAPVDSPAPRKLSPGAQKARDAAAKRKADAALASNAPPAPAPAPVDSPAPLAPAMDSAPPTRLCIELDEPSHAMPAPASPAPVVGIEYDGAPMDSAPVNPPAPAPVDSPERKASAIQQVIDSGIKGAGIDESAPAERLERIARQERMLKRAGLSTGPTIRPIGMTLIDSGKAKYREMQREWESMPTTGEACQMIIDAVDSENREDISETTTGIRMLDNGDIATQSGGILGFEPRGLKSFASEILQGSEAGRVWDEDGAESSSGYLLGCTPEMRAAHLNYWMSHYNIEGRRDKSATRNIVLRTREGANGKRNVFAVVSPTYSVDCDVDEFARIMRDTVKPGARCEALYDGYRLTLDAIYANPESADSVGVGEVFRAGIRATTGDARNKGGAFRGTATRIRCVNLTTLRASSKVKARRHRGDGLRARMIEDAKLAEVSIAEFATLWGEAEKERIIEANSNPGDTFETLIKAGFIKIPGIKADEMKAKLVRAWEVEPSNSKRGIINAMTRAAHSNPWVNPWARQELEAQAGELLYVSVRL